MNSWLRLNWLVSTDKWVGMGVAVVVGTAGADVAVVLDAPGEVAAVVTEAGS